jgi:HEPN domain-containing protein
MAALNRESLQRLALERLDDVEALLAAKRHGAAYYLAGYVVECGLKACIAKQTKQFDFPEKGRSDKVFIHDLEQLVSLAGLRPHLEQDRKSDQDLEAN